MSTPDEDRPDQARALFAAARRERPAKGVRARTLLALHASIAERSRREGQAPVPGVRPVEPPDADIARLPRVTNKRRWSRASSAAALGLAAAVAWLIAGRARLTEPPREDYAIEAVGEDMDSTRSPQAPVPEEQRRAAQPPPAEPAVAPTAVTPASREHARRLPSAEPARTASLDLHGEIALLDQARQALAAGHHATVLRLLDRHRTAAGDKQLAAEAALLRIETHAAAGRTATSARLARQFIRENPHSALSDRARAFTQADTHPDRGASP